MVFTELEKCYSKIIGKNDFKRIRNNIWLYSKYKPYYLPSCGFKLHIFCTILNVSEIVIIVANYCKINNIYFKVIKSIKDLELLNRGFYGYSQIGKAITIYPTDNTNSLEIAANLEILLSNFSSAGIPSDYRYKNSIIFYRYGGYFLENDESYILVNGVKQLDERNGIPVPKGVENIFEKYTLTNSPLDDINKQYIILTILRMRGRGNVYLGLSKTNENLVVIKEGRKYSEINIENRDGFDRVCNEATIFKKLKELTPEIIDFYKTDERCFLITSYNNMKSLKDLILEGNFNEEEIREFMIKLINLIKKIHNKGIIIRDISPDNLLTNFKNIYFTDLEYAILECEKENYYAPIGTPGFSKFSKTKMSSSYKPEFDDDYYSLFAIYNALINPADYKMFIEKSLKSIFSDELVLSAWNIGKNNKNKKIRDVMDEIVPPSLEVLEVIIRGMEVN